MVKLLIVLIMSGALASALAPSPPPLLIQDTTAPSLDASN
jgi:hypothetical protein